MPSVDISISAFGFGLTFAQLLLIFKECDGVQHLPGLSS